MAEILVSVEDRVTRGTALATLDNRQALEGAVLAAEANLAVRQAALAQTRSAIAAARPKRRQRSTRPALPHARPRTSLARTEDLAGRGVATEAALDAARTAAEEAALAVQTRASDARPLYRRRLDEQPDVVVAARNARAAEAELARARMDLARAEVRAPIERHDPRHPRHAGPAPAEPRASWRWATPSP